MIRHLESNALLASPPTFVDYHYYSALPLCVIAAVFSIGVKFKGVQNTIARFCQDVGWPPFRDPTSQLKPDTPTIGDFVNLLAHWTSDELAGRVFRNRQRTSSKNGILKAEAVRLFSQALVAEGIETFLDATDNARMERAESAVRRIPGQASGVSFAFFWMLAGSDNHVKPDRMIQRFVENALASKPVSRFEAANLVRETAGCLAAINGMTPRQLDYIIWNFESARAIRANRNSQHPQ
jgi:hypothetical protein